MSAERTRLESRLTAIRTRTDAAYIDKLDCKITEDFWARRTSDWRKEDQQIKMAIDGFGIAEIADKTFDAQKVFEHSNKAYLLYVSQDSIHQRLLMGNSTRLPFLDGSLENRL
jgi:hypothetical protein